jgi:hypothetical protein
MKVILSLFQLGLAQTWLSGKDGLLEKAQPKTVIWPRKGKIGDVAAVGGSNRLGWDCAHAWRLQQMRSVLGRLDAAPKILQVGSPLIGKLALASIWRGVGET